MFWRLLTNKILIRIFGITIILVGYSCFSQTRYLELDVEKSLIEFEARHLGVLKVVGAFKFKHGNVIFSENQMRSLTGEVNVSSLDSSNAERDETMLSEPYLDDRNFPTINFNSVMVNDRSIEGVLNLKGVERDITITYTKETSDSLIEVFILGETIILRDHFDLEFGSMDMLIGNEIKITLKLFTIEK